MILEIVTFADHEGNIDIVFYVDNDFMYKQRIRKERER